MLIFTARQDIYYKMKPVKDDLEIQRVATIQGHLEMVAIFMNVN